MSKSENKAADRKRKRSNETFALTGGERTFETINLIVLILIGALMLFPFLNMAAKSFSSENAILTGKVLFWPVGFQTGTYKYVIRQAQFWNSFKVSVMITLMGTAGAMIISCLTAYPLSKTWLYGRKPLLLLFVFTMLFGGGMVPSYLLMRSLGLINTIWVLFVPAMLSVYNMILLKNFFEDIPDSIEESAELDGAGSLRILVSIVLPMSLPAIATIGLFYAVGFWDNYMSGLLYITKPELKPLQQYLYEIVTESINVDKEMSMDAQENAALNTDAIRSATIMLACVPIMCVYPFLQKYFVKGMRVGSVKG
ncbi:MAG: carbohydrate ABC transporter permease [Eubacteriales bacterium]|nr:carbohydrate ABC transporter permease [bacterium]MDY2792202.1 carbohydrate ABC transporter permease [Eubacteriales bacterium]